MLKKIAAALAILVMASPIFAVSSANYQRLQAGWPEVTEAASHTKPLSSSAKSRLQTALGASVSLPSQATFYTIYNINAEEDTIGRVYFTTATGSNGAIELSVGVKYDKIIGIHVWKHNEPAFIDSTAFRNSFNGKTYSDDFTPQLSANPLSQSTINAISSAVKQALYIMCEAKEQNILVKLESN